MFDDITSKISIPSEVKNLAAPLTDKILLNTRHNKEDFMESIESISRAVKITPFSYVDKRRYYTYIDAAYYMYIQLRKDGMSSTTAWIISNLAILNWHLKALFGIMVRGQDIEKHVDLAKRHPIIYSLRNCLLSSIQLAISHGIFGSMRYGFVILMQINLSITMNMMRLLFKIQDTNNSYLTAVSNTTKTV